MTYISGDHVTTSQKH